jgi:hypothetical protein
LETFLSPVIGILAVDAAHKALNYYYYYSAVVCRDFDFFRMLNVSLDNILL